MNIYIHTHVYVRIHPVSNWPELKGTPHNAHCTDLLLIEGKIHWPFPEWPMGTGQHLRAWCVCNCWVGIQIHQKKKHIHSPQPVRSIHIWNNNKATVWAVLVASPVGLTRPAAWAYCMFQLGIMACCRMWPKWIPCVSNTQWSWPKWLGPDHPTFWKTQKKQQLEQQLS